jgi:hypothetical protein
MPGPSNGVVTGLDFGLPPGELDLVRISARIAVAFFDAQTRALSEFCLLMEGGVIVAWVSGDRFRLEELAIV